jgi:Uma2 family endonuclease
MSSVEDVKQVLRRLSYAEREEISFWLQQVLRQESERGEVREPRPAYAVSEPEFMTLEAYFEFEDQSPIRHEYVNGVLYAMTGPSLKHNLISQRLCQAFSERVRGGPCETFICEVKLLLKTAVDEVVYYPDVIVDCRPNDREEYCVRNPKLVVEVLSPSTRRIDQTEKLLRYQSIDSIEEYVLVEQHRYGVTVRRRAEEWHPQAYIGGEAVAEFRSIGLFLPLRQIYEDLLSDLSG